MSDFFDEVEVPEQWQVREYKDADWAMQMIALAQRRIDQREIQAIALKKQIDERLEIITKTDKATIEFFTAELEPWVQAEIKDQKAKSTKMTFGSAGFRSAGGSLIIEDEEKAVSWLESNDHLDAVKIKKTVIKSEAKKYGPFPGARLEPKTDKFHVKPDYSLFLDDK